MSSVEQRFGAVRLDGMRRALERDIARTSEKGSSDSGPHRSAAISGSATRGDCHNGVGDRPIAKEVAPHQNSAAKDIFHEGAQSS